MVSRRRKVNTGAMLEKVSQFFSSLGEKRVWKICGYAIKKSCPC